MQLHECAPIVRRNSDDARSADPGQGARLRSLLEQPLSMCQIGIAVEHHENKTLDRADISRVNYCQSAALVLLLQSENRQQHVRTDSTHNQLLLWAIPFWLRCLATRTARPNPRDQETVPEALLFSIRAPYLS